MRYIIGKMHLKCSTSYENVSYVQRLIEMKDLFRQSFFDVGFLPARCLFLSFSFSSWFNVKPLYPQAQFPFALKMKFKFSSAGFTLPLPLSIFYSQFNNKSSILNRYKFSRNSNASSSGYTSTRLDLSKFKDVIATCLPSVTSADVHYRNVMQKIIQPNHANVLRYSHKIRPFSLFASI